MPITKEVQLHDVPVKDIKLDKKNPRKNESAIPAVARSLRLFGYVKESIVVDENMVPLTGDTTLKAHIYNDKLEHDPELQKQYLDMYPDETNFSRHGISWNVVTRVLQVFGLTEDEKEEYRILDNRSHEEATWDETKLRLSMRRLQDRGRDLSRTGFNPREVKVIVRDVAPAENKSEIEKGERTTSRNIENYEGDNDSGGDEPGEEKQEEKWDSIQRREGGAENGHWLIHFAFSTQAAAEEFARKNGFEVQFPPNQRMISLDLTE